MAFDTNGQIRMPYNGTIFKVGAKGYLLFNNTRYKEASAPTDREHHFTGKISVFSDKAELLADPALINQLIDMVY